MKKILVTGADGFIGSHLVEQLVSLGYEVRALSLYNSFNYWGWLEDIKCLDKIEVVTGDIRDPFYCEIITKDVDTIFNLAALIAIPYSYMAPSSYVETNVLGTVNLCQAAIRNEVKGFIQISTSETYGTAQYVPIDEKHPMQPQSPYSASKIASDAMAMSFYYSHKLPITIARPFNTYGPRQSARAVIPTIITQILSGKKSINLGDMTPTRDFTFVTDTCAGLLALATSPTSIGKVVNIGSNYEISVEETLNIIKKIMKSDIEVELDSNRLRPEKSEVRRLWCDNTLLFSLTGFRPQISFKEGLVQTIEWFSQASNLSKYKSSIYNI